MGENENHLNIGLSEENTVSVLSIDSISNPHQDDILDFPVNISKNENAISHKIRNDFGTGIKESLKFQSEQ